MLLSLARGLTQGRRAGTVHAIGVALGIMAHTVLAAFGVSLLLLAHEAAFWAMKLAGAAYLIYLGIMQWKQATPELNPKVAPMSYATILWRGFLSNALNPKVALFVIAFVPQFVRVDNANASAFMQITMLGAIFAALTVLAYASLAVVADRVSHWLGAHPAFFRWFNRGTGGVFVASGAALVLLEKR